MIPEVVVLYHPPPIRASLMEEELWLAQFVGRQRLNKSKSIVESLPPYFA